MNLGQIIETVILKNRLAILMIFLGIRVAFAQTDTTWLRPYTSDIKDFTIQNFEDKISITSQGPLLLKEAPGTVSIFNEDDIQALGARDMVDVLRLIPGIEFGVDVQGVVGIGSRGNHANEAVLILIDGIEMNDLLFGSNQFGNHFPIDQIRRIEVIRGPGTVMYGGLAVFAVINIMTKSSEWYNGIRISQTLGQTEGGMARRNFSGSIAHSTERLKVSVIASASEANRSDRQYTDYAGNSYSMLHNSGISNRFMAFHLRTGNFFLKGVADFYDLQVRDNQTDISSRAYPLKFSSYHSEARYQFKFGDHLIIAPYLNLRYQLPWYTPPGVDSVDTDKVIVYKISASRALGGVTTNWKPRKNLDLMFTGNFWRDEAKDFFNPDSLSESASYTCKTLLGQGLWRTRWANLTLGLRFDYHSYYHPILSPRIAVNRTFGKSHIKASYNRSFRTPAMSNISLRVGEEIKPQITDYYEIEAGYSPDKNLALSLNAYQIRIRNGIVFSVLDDGFSERYSNAAKMGTQGIEAETKYTFGGMSLQCGYSFYTNKGMNQYAAFTVPEKNLNLAFPAHKVFLQYRWQIDEKFRFNNTFIWLSDRFGYNGDDENPDYINYGKVFQWNLFLQAKDLYIKGLTIGAGVYDITNSRYSFIQPYNSGHMPLPAMSREYVLKITYGISLIRNP